MTALPSGGAVVVLPQMQEKVIMRGVRNGTDSFNGA